MPAIRKTAEQHELSGAYKKNPNRRPKGTIPKSIFPIGDPPAYFNKAEKICWEELCGIIPETVLTNADRWVVEIASRLMAKFRNRDEVTTAAELSRLSNALSLMGATPVDRTRLTVKDAVDTSNPFADFVVN